MWVETPRTVQAQPCAQHAPLYIGHAHTLTAPAMVGVAAVMVEAAMEAWVVRAWMVEAAMVEAAVEA